MFGFGENDIGKLHEKLSDLKKDLLSLLKQDLKIIKEEEKMIEEAILELKGINGGNKLSNENAKKILARLNLIHQKLKAVDHLSAKETALTTEEIFNVSDLEKGAKTLVNRLSKNQ